MAENKRIWSRDDVFELIAMYQANPVLWDAKCRDFSSRALKTSAIESIAEHFETSVDQVLKKVHNLRSQLAQELKKQATRRSKDGMGKRYVSKWPYFKVLSFLTPDVPSTASIIHPTLPVTIVGQPADQDLIDMLGPDDLRPPDSFDPSIEDQSGSDIARPCGSRKRCAETELSSEEVLLKAIKVLTEPEDEFQVFGRYVASELRGFYSDESRRHLKRAIQRAVLEASEMDDMLRLSGHHDDPLANH